MIVLLGTKEVKSYIKETQLLRLHINDWANLYIYHTAKQSIRYADRSVDCESEGEVGFCDKVISSRQMDSFQTSFVYTTEHLDCVRRLTSTKHQTKLFGAHPFQMFIKKHGHSGIE